MPEVINYKFQGKSAILWNKVNSMSPVSNGFVAYVLDQLSGWGDVTSQRMFGGAGLYRDGKMFALISDDAAYLKADHTNRDLFERAGSAPFKPYPDKQMTMSSLEIQKKSA